MSSNKIVLTSSDGQTFEIDEAVALKSKVIAHMIEDGCTGKEIPIHNVTGDILAKVIEYCKKHVEVAEDEEAKKKLEIWDAEFMKLDLETLFKIVVAANYFDIKELIDLTCQTIADLIKDKMPEEIRDIFNIENDYTPEEEAQVRKENHWAFE